MKFIPGVAVFAVAVILAGCSAEPVGCDPCPAGGCPTTEAALTEWNALIGCARGLNFEDSMPAWAARWADVPPGWIVACVESVTCTSVDDGFPVCSDADNQSVNCAVLNNPLLWGDEDTMDECLLAQRGTAGASCDGDLLVMCSVSGGGTQVDCADFCGSSDGTCVYDAGSDATCTCGFPLGE